jgi:hypothetical protein
LMMLLGHCRQGEGQGRRERKGRGQLQCLTHSLTMHSECRASGFAPPVRTNLSV